MGRYALIALSLANLLFLIHWSPLLNRRNAYALKSRLGDHLLALMFDVTLTATLFWLTAFLVRRSGNARAQWLTQVAFLLVVFAAFLRWQPAEKWLVQHTGMLAAPLVLLLWCGLAGFVATRPRVVRALAVFLLILSPFALATFGQGLWLLIRERGAEASYVEAAGPRLGTRPRAPRIVWILFDELDYQISIERRPATVAMPELDRLRSEALHTTAAYPPSNQTVSSIPALLDGRLVAEAEPRDADHLMIRYHGASTPVLWGSQPNLFSRARETGVNGSVVGWFHPYCRVFRGLLSQCSWEENADNTFAVTGGNLVEGMRVQAEVVVRFFSPPPFNGVRYQTAIAQSMRRRAVQDHEAILRSARDALHDADLGLVLIHISIPHPPGIFDRRSRTYRTDIDLSYFDNLELADRDLGDLRRILEQTGQWEGAVVLVSSDHAWRPEPHRLDFGWTAEDEAASVGHSDYRVPFLLKMPGQVQALSYEPAFNTVLSQDLLLAILRGEVKTAEDAARWLGAHRTNGRSPYIQNPR